MLLGSKHFWIVACMLLLVAILQYPQQLLFIGENAPESLLGTERHALERVIFLLPITYAGVVFGMRAGICVTFVSLAIMVPRDIWISWVPVATCVRQYSSPRVSIHSSIRG